MLSKAPWGSSSTQKPEEEEQSLTTILRTAEERSDLNRLIVECTENMRNAQHNLFQVQKSADAKQDAKSGEMQRQEIEEPGLSPEEREAKEKARREEERLIRDLSSPAMLELKVAALAHFDDWRDSVIIRVGEVINQRDDPPEEHEKTASEMPRRKPVPSEAEVRPQLPPRPAWQSETEKISKKSNQAATDKLRELYPPIKTPLLDLSEAQRILILHSLLLLLLSLERYTAQSRILLLHVLSSLDLPLELLTGDETKVAQGLLEVAQTHMTADAETQDKIKKNANNRKWKVGLGAVAGATILAVTGGLAAPLLAAGVGAVMGGLGLGATAAAGYMGALASSSVLIGGLFGAYGGRMTSKMVDKYAKEVEDFAFLPIHRASRFRKPDQDPHRLRIAIGVSGWLTEEEEVVKPWKVVGNGIEAFALRWELEALVKLGNALSTLLKSAAWGIAKKEIITRTLFATLAAGLWPLMIVKASNIIDNPFSVAKFRSDKAGKVLAEALINKCQGERPVTLIGYSLGARVIYSCLLTLAERNAFGLIESVIFMGAPTPSDPIEWRKLHSVVAGRVVNAYSTKDLILAYLYRTSSLQSGIAGLQEIKNVPGVENVDVSEYVDGHLKYRYLTSTILTNVGFESIDAHEAALEEEELKQEEAKEEAARKEAEAKEGEEDVDAEVAEMEKQVEEKNRASTGWMTRRLSALKVGSKGNEKSEVEMSEQQKLAVAQGEDVDDASSGAGAHANKSVLDKAGSWLGGLTSGQSNGPKAQPAPSNSK